MELPYPGCGNILGEFLAGAENVLYLGVLLPTAMAPGHFVLEAAEASFAGDLFSRALFVGAAARVMLVRTSFLERFLTCQNTDFPSRVTIITGLARALFPGDQENQGKFVAAWAHQYYPHNGSLRSSFVIEVLKALGISGKSE